VPPRPGEPFLFSIFEGSDLLIPRQVSFAEFPGWRYRWDFVAGGQWTPSVSGESVVALFNRPSNRCDASRILGNLLVWELEPGETVAGLTLLRRTEAFAAPAAEAPPAPAPRAAEDRGVRYKLFVDPYQGHHSFSPFQGGSLAVTLLVPLPWALDQHPEFGVCLRNPLGEWLYPGDVYRHAALARRGFRLITSEAVSVSAVA
jgi:hypothetical protein